MRIVVAYAESMQQIELGVSEWVYELGLRMEIVACIQMINHPYGWSNY